MMELGITDKFFIQDDDENLILVDEINIIQDMIKNNYMTLRGTRFYVDYETNNIDKANSRVEVQISFDIEDISEVE